MIETRSYTAVFDGSFGIDSEDILNIPQIGFSSSQLYPDQFKYGPPDSRLPPFNQTVQVGVDWIKKQATLVNV
jgi:mannan endo-1,4-beta-mannosidase